MFGLVGLTLQSDKWTRLRRDFILKGATRHQADRATDNINRQSKRKHPIAFEKDKRRFLSLCDIHCILFSCCFAIRRAFVNRTEVSAIRLQSLMGAKGFALAHYKRNSPDRGSEMLGRRRLAQDLLRPHHSERFSFPFATPRSPRGRGARRACFRPSI